jgi:ketosteroid isomerase-like protein
MAAADSLRAMYEAFNARDIDAVLGQMAEDVDWPNSWEGGRVHGREAVREYWMRQWAAIDPTVEPLAFTTRSDGSIAVEVRQVVRGLDGTQLADARVTHAYVLRDGRQDTSSSANDGGACPADERSGA